VRSASSTRATSRRRAMPMATTSTRSSFARATAA
jgi:hypothetical protein